MEIVANSETENPAQIYDMDSGKYIDNPDLKKTAKSEENEEEEETEEEEVVNPKAKSKDSEEENEEEESEESEDSEEEEESEDESEETEESEEDEEEKEVDDNFEEYESVDQLIEKTFSKFEVKSQAELEELVDNAVDLIDEVEELKKQNSELKTAAPKFANPAQESAFKFVSQFDPSMQGEALQTFAKLIGMDIDAADPKMILEEKFIHENPHFTRAKAIRMFEKEYTAKYNLIREKFDGTDAEFKIEQEDVDIMKEGEVAKAKKYLKELREKNKPATEAETPKTNEVVTKAIEQNAKTYNDFIEKKAEVNFGEGKNKFVFKLEGDRKKQVSLAMKNWVSNPASYNDKGVLVGPENPEQMLNAVIGGLFLDDVIKAAYASASSKVGIERVDELHTRSPKKRSAPASGEGKESGDGMDSSALRIIKTRKKAA
jgi:hypothetical protein